MYKSFYKLAKNPFEPTPNPDFLYLSPLHKKALSYLTYSLNKNTDFAQLTGEIGCGKTTLILTLLKSFGQDISYAYVVDPKLPFTALLRTLLCQLGLQANGYQEPAKDVLLAQFYEYLKGQSASGRRVVIILDEAQNIEPAVLEELRMLSNLDTGKHRPLLTMLVGQPELRFLLGRPELAALKQRIAVATHLPPLDRLESEKYINYRLKQAGANGLPLFTPKAVNKIFEFSRGIPRLLNLVCESSLLAGYLEEMDKLDDSLVGAVVKELEEDLQCPAPPSSPKDPKESHMEEASTPFKPTPRYRSSTNVQPPDTEIKKGLKKNKLIKKGLFESNKLKIALISTFGTMGAAGLGLLVYLLSQ